MSQMRTSLQVGTSHIAGAALAGAWRLRPHRSSTASNGLRGSTARFRTTTCSKTTTGSETLSRFVSTAMSRSIGMRYPTSTPTRTGREARHVMTFAAELTRPCVIQSRVLSCGAMCWRIWISNRAVRALPTILSPATCRTGIHLGIGSKSAQMPIIHRLYPISRRESRSKSVSMGTKWSPTAGHKTEHPSTYTSTTAGAAAATATTIWTTRLLTSQSRQSSSGTTRVRSRRSTRCPR